MKQNHVLEDERIVELLRQRSETAIDEIRRKYGLYLTAIANHVLHDSLDAEECVNDAYLQVWQSASSENVTNLRIYLAKVVRNIAISRLRSAQAKKRGGGVSTLPYEELSESIPDKMVGVDEETEILRAKMNRFLKDLPLEKRNIFLKRFWFSLSIPEIAEQLGCSERYVNNQLYTMKKRLKKFLEEGDT